MKKDEKKRFDVVILGGGPGGISAALWCDELGLSAVLLEKENELGGQLLWTYNAIENHLGTKAANGLEMRDIFLKQIEKRKFIKHLQAEIKEARLGEKRIILKNCDEFFGDSIIIATGVRRRKLNIPGEDFFHGKGIIDSGKKNAEKVADKKVLIVGGGDAALENALILSEKAEKVYLSLRRNEFRGRIEFIEKVKKNKKVEILYETELVEINGAEKVKTVAIRDKKGGKIRELEVDFVLPRIGVAPNIELFGGQINLDKNGYIETDSFCRTNISAVYAVGDVANPISPTISTAVGMGATAAKEIYSYFHG